MSIPPMQSSNPTTDMKREIASLWKFVKQAASSIQRFERVTIGRGGITLTEGGFVEAVGGIIRSRYFLLRGELWSTFVGFNNDAAGTHHRVGDLDGTEVGAYSSWGPVALRTPTNDVRLSHTTTSSTANAVLDATTQRIYRTTSSRRYKQDIEDAAFDLDDVRAMRPRTWRDRNEVADNPDTTRRFIGFIAEEFDERPTLRQFVNYDDQGPESIGYDRIVTALHALIADVDVRQQEDARRIVALEQRVADLTARLEGPEGGAGA